MKCQCCPHKSIEWFLYEATLAFNGLSPAEYLNNDLNIFYVKHCIKSVRIQSYFGPYFPAFGLNTEGHSVSLRIQSECGEIRARITPNTDTFHAVKCTKITEAHLGPCQTSMMEVFCQNS